MFDIRAIKNEENCKTHKNIPSKGFTTQIEPGRGLELLRDINF